jgi:hypothetical protein
MQAFVSIDTTLAGPILPLSPTPPNDQGLSNSILSIAMVTPNRNYNRTESRALIGYNVYRDSQLLTPQPFQETVYYDTLIIAGTFEYEVTAVYDEGESQPAGPVIVTLDSMQPAFAPAGWKPVANNIYHNIMIPLPVVQQSGNVLEPGDWIGVFFQMDTGLSLAGMGYWDGVEDLSIHAFPDHELTPEKDGFHQGDPFTWMIHRESENEEFVVKVTYDQNMPDFDGQYVHNGESRLLSVTAETFGVNETGPAGGISLFPNPARNSVTLLSPSQVFRTEIFSSSGRVVTTVENQWTGVLNIDIRNLENGIYFVRINTNSGISTLKLLVY